MASFNFTFLLIPVMNINIHLVMLSLFNVTSSDMKKYSEALINEAIFSLKTGAIPKIIKYLHLFFPWRTLQLVECLER